MQNFFDSDEDDNEKPPAKTTIDLTGLDAPDGFPPITTIENNLHSTRQELPRPPSPLMVLASDDDDDVSQVNSVPLPTAGDQVADPQQPSKKARARARRKAKRLLAEQSAAKLKSTENSANFIPKIVVDTQIENYVHEDNEGGNQEDKDDNNSIEDIIIPSAKITHASVDDEPASLARNRYWMDPLASRTCFSCGKRGHMRSQCAAPQPCNFCGLRSHQSRNCVTSTCYNCFRPGHLVRGCPRPSKASVACYKCQRRGHGPQACPSLWRSYVENKNDHNSTQRVDSYCFNCGRDGHFGEECKKDYAYYTSKVYSNTLTSAFTSSNLKSRSRSDSPSQRAGAKRPRRDMYDDDARHNDMRRDDMRREVWHREQSNFSRYDSSRDSRLYQESQRPNTNYGSYQPSTGFVRAPSFHQQQHQHQAQFHSNNFPRSNASSSSTPMFSSRYQGGYRRV